MAELLICPSCLHVIDNVWEYFGATQGDGDSVQFECENCETPLKATMSVETSYFITKRKQSADPARLRAQE